MKTQFIMYLKLVPIQLLLLFIMLSDLSALKCIYNSYNSICMSICITYGRKIKLKSTMYGRFCSGELCLYLKGKDILYLQRVFTSLLV